MEVAQRIEGKSSMEMRDILGIPNDWKSEEQKQLPDERGTLLEKQ